MPLFSRQPEQQQAEEEVARPEDATAHREESEEVSRYRSVTERAELLVAFTNQFGVWGCEPELKDGMAEVEGDDDMRSARNLAVIAAFKAIRMAAEGIGEFGEKG